VRPPATIAVALAAAALVSGCHLLFPYEERTPDGAPPALDVGDDGARDMVEDGDRGPDAPVPDKSAAPDKKAPPDKKPPPDKKAPPDVKPWPDKMLVPDAGCPKGTKKCGKVCVDLLTDKDNCGQCGAKCSGSNMDRCHLGKCVCGKGAKAPCSGSLNCYQGACKCLSGGLCQGCCSNNTCYSFAKQGKGTCGKGGAKCKACNDANECTDNSCLLGQCSFLQNTSSCKSGAGKCLKGKCCTTCVKNGACVGAVSGNQCGAKGGACTLCPALSGFPCKQRICTGSGACGTANVPNGSTCTDPATKKAGLCKNGLCCSGCWTAGGNCKPLGSQTPGKCGKGGQACMSCSDGEDCTTDSCTNAGVCSNLQLANGASCAGGKGKCSQGKCCTGCFNPATKLCVKPANQTVNLCGNGAVECLNCGYSGPDTCKQGACNTATGACTVTNKPDGTNCKPGYSKYICCSGFCSYRASGTC